MAGLTGQGTTFGLPNFVGELFAKTPQDTPLLSAIGGLSGGKQTLSTLHQWSEYDLRDADKNRQRLEGADAPTAEARVRANVTNVVEIHQEALDVTYTKMAATGQFNSTGSTNPGSVGVAGTNPVASEWNFQVGAQLAQIARDVERGFLNGTFANPANNATPRKTRGLLPAITTNVVDKGTLVGNGASTMDAAGTITEAAHGLSVNDVVVARSLTSDAIGPLEEDWLYHVTAQTANTFTLSRTQGGATITFAGAGGTADFYEAAAMTKGDVVDLMQSVYDNGGMMESETATLITGSTGKRSLTKLFIDDANYREETRNMGGVAVTTIQTDFGILNVMLNRHMPSGALCVASLEQVLPVFLLVPEKGFLFVEPLSTTGSSRKAQIYGEIGLEYGNENAHGKLLGVKLAAGA